MKIYDLPKKANLAYLDAQYFHNDPKPGVAEHVIKIQYRTKRGELQSFIIPVSNDLRNINRMSKKQLGEAGGKLVKDRAKQLTKAQIQFFFGFRLVRYVDITPAGGKLNKKKSDGKTQCWVEVKEDHLEVEMTWNGEIMKVKILPHQKTHENVKASLGIGYYDKDQELKDNIARLKDDTRIQDDATDAEAEITRTAGADRADEPSGTEDDESGDGAESTGRGIEDEVSSSNTGSSRVCASDAIARATGNGKADSVCASDSTQVVVEEVQEQKPAKRVRKADTAKPDRSVQAHPSKANKRTVVDRNEWGVWQPKGLSGEKTELGTSISLFPNV